MLHVKIILLHIDTLRSPKLRKLLAIAHNFCCAINQFYHLLLHLSEQQNLCKSKHTKQHMYHYVYSGFYLTFWCLLCTKRSYIPKQTCSSHVQFVKVCVTSLWTSGVKELKRTLQVIPRILKNCRTDIFPELWEWSQDKQEDPSIWLIIWNNLKFCVIHWRKNTSAPFC